MMCFNSFAILLLWVHFKLLICMHTFDVFSFKTIYFVLCISVKRSLEIVLYLKFCVRGLMSYLRYLCLFAHSGVQCILCCVFVLFVFVLCTLCRQFLGIVYFWLPLRYSLTFVCLCLVYPMSPVSLDCLFLIAPSVFSNICLSSSSVLYGAFFFGFFIFAFPFLILLFFFVFFT
jgi:hypothetical protein